MIKTDLWPQVNSLLGKCERPSRYIDHEWGSMRAVYKPDADFSFCMIYPDTYELGQANQAIRILANAVNVYGELLAERAFLPASDMIDLMREAGVPMFSLESCAPVHEFDVVGITLPHELASTNVLELLDLSGIPIRSVDRAEDDPIVIGGGPCAYNPEPYAPFFDAISIGEGEESVPELVFRVRQLRAEGKSRDDILRGLADVEGTYVPSLYRVLDEEEAQKTGSWVVPISPEVPSVITKRLFEGFAKSDAWEPMVVPYTEVVHDRLNVEVLRGCARGCRFCQAGMMYRPVRERSADNIVNAVKRGLAATGYDEVSLTSLSTTDHSQIEEILNRLNKEYAGRGVRISIPSQRLDSFGVGMAELVAGQKKGGLTFAPEAGTQRLRDVINKNVTEEDLFNAVDSAIDAGWRRVKLYFMIGLPTETDDDIKGIASLAQRVYDRMREAVPKDQRGQLRMVVSAALFVPKAQTPFQWDGQISPDEARRRARLLKSSVKYRAIDVNYHEPATSFIEAVTSRGGREVADLIEAAWRCGARFDAWTEYFDAEAWQRAVDDAGIDIDAIARTSYESERVMPWAHISCGVSAEFLKNERELAKRGQATEDCTYGSCTACGVCPMLGSKNLLAGDRNG